MEFFENLPGISQIPLGTRILAINVLIVFISFIIAWLLRKRIARLCTAPIRALTTRTSSNMDDIWTRHFEKVVGYVVLAIPLYASLLLLPFEPPWPQLINQLAFSLLLFAAFRFLYDVATTFFASVYRFEKLTGQKIDKALLPLISVSARSLVVVFGVVSIAQLWGWNVAGLVTGLGLGGLTISLAAKDILDDVLGYAVIITDNIFREEEYIVSAYAEGIVENIGLRSTRVRQLNQGLVTVPNSKLSDDWVVNWSRLEKRWFNFVVGVTLSSTADRIREFVQLLPERLKAREHVDEESVVVLFTEYDDSSLSILVRCYVNLPDWVDAHAERQEVNLLIMQTLHETGLEVAFPSRSLYLESIPGRSKNGASNNGDKRAAQSQHHQEHHREERPVEHQNKRSGDHPFSQDDDKHEIADKAAGDDDDGILD
ncbi:mechanosensitive ion channel [Phototrophicus methaneseepsis]|uniref:Mechanosensitive ion channel n=1 Tax=Phototrophicus methaneseepsis TaxID=2710758 RepID=A0A7S8E8Z8_9CHLR|nr:mechanosensitive ion channel family protein [Phototrophicus methaneseepsis]QPC82581.1 mechanosensitive ion channel [Phototrophicus methaneseepsis]